jgi:metal-dependent hydrolase (beta-lactamase superfamily II)
MVKAPCLRGAHKQEEPASLMDYNECKIWVIKLEKILSCHCFQGKSMKWLKKFFSFSV